MENTVWIVVLVIVGTVMVISGIANITAGVIGLGVVQLLIAAFNYAVAIWRVAD